MTREEAIKNDPVVWADDTHPVKYPGDVVGKVKHGHISVFRNDDDDGKHLDGYAWLVWSDKDKKFLSDDNECMEFEAAKRAASDAYYNNIYPTE